MKIGLIEIFCPEYSFQIVISAILGLPLPPSPPFSRMAALVFSRNLRLDSAGPWSSISSTVSLIKLSKSLMSCALMKAPS